MINAVDKELDNMMDNINGQISVLSDKIDAKTSTDSEELIQKLDEIKAANEALSEQLLEVKEEISVNVHKECVKCYRNVQTVIEELQIPKMEDIEKKMNASVSGIKGSVWFGIFLVAVQLALFILNVLGYLPV